MKCPKCDGDMKEGVVTYKDSPYRYRLSFVWGPIRKGFFGGDTVKKDNGEVPVKSYACMNCGYVERYLDPGV